MSSENKGEVRSNYASRLLSKMMSERSKDGAKDKTVTTAEAAKYAVEVDVKQLTAALKG